MRKNFYLSILFILLFSFAGKAQTTIFSENMGTPTGTTLFAANVWQNNAPPIIFTGTGDVRNTTASSGYTAATGGGNVFLTNTVGRNFMIEGINTSSYTGITLTFGLNKSSTSSTGSELTVEVSSDGISFSTLATTSLPTGSGTAIWYLSSATGTIPSTTNLRIRFTNTTTGTAFRIDDVVLKGNLPTGPTNIASGDWADALTWSTGTPPTPAEDAVLLFDVFTLAPLTRNAGTTTTVTAGRIFSIVGTTFTENGTMIVDGTFKINTGGYANGTGAFKYGTNGSLAFETNNNYVVNNTDIFWPAAPVLEVPKNVKVNNGGLVLGSGMIRTVPLFFTTYNNVAGFGGVRFDPNALKLEGTIQIFSGGYFLEKPIYGAASTLIYTMGGTFGRGLEWTEAVGTIGITPGYPNNVQITSNTILNYNNGIPLAKSINGNLTVVFGSTFDMGYGGGNSGGALTVNGNLVNNGTFRLGNQNSVDDFRLGGDLTNTGTFDGKSRTTFFTKAGTQRITSSAPITIPYISLTSGSTNVLLNPGTNVDVAAPTTGIAINFSAGGDNIDINGNTLTVGTSGVSNNISGGGTFSGSATSNLTLLGTGDVGTIRFATGKQLLKDFTLNRTLPPATQSVVTLASPLTIGTTLNLTNGILDLGNNLLTIDKTAAINGASALNYIVADAGYGTSAGIRKNISSGGVYVLPIGDRYASADGSQYSPITVEGTGGSYTTTAYVQASVSDIKHPNFDAATDFISRYWTVTTGGVSGTVTNFRSTGTYTLADVSPSGGPESAYLGNKWDGTSWSNAGSTVNAVAHNTNTVPCVIGQLNEITAGVRDQNINVKTTVGNVTYVHNSTYDFGTIPSNVTVATQFTIENLGQRLLNVANLGFTGSPNYTYTTPFVNGAIAGPSGTKTFTVSFTPTTAGTFTGSITILNNSIDGTETPYVINFTGVATTPVPNMNVKANGGGNGNVPNGSSVGLPLSNTQWSSTTVGSSSPKNLMIQNNGTATLILTNPSPNYITIGGNNPGDFSITTQPAGTIAASGSSNFTITFTPTAAGNRNAVVSIPNNDATKNPYTFYIEGTGTGPEIDVYGNGVQIVNPTTVASTGNGTDFGNVDFTGSSVTRIFTVSNIGNSNLTFTGVTPTLSGATTEFTVTPLPASLAADSEVTFLVTFDPTSIGVKTATISIASNDYDENPYTFVVQGNGTNYSDCAALGLPVDFALQNFDGTANPINWVFTNSSVAGAAAAVITNGSAYGNSRIGTTPKFNGVKSFQIRGNFGSSTTELATTIEFATIDASLYKEVALNFQLGAYSTGTVQGLDVSPENVKVFISLDGGANYSNELTISGNSNSIWSVVNGAAAVTRNFDGNNVTNLTVPAAGGTNTGPRNITLNNLPSASQLRVKIVLAIDRTDELWVIDDVKLSGRKEGVSTWNGTAWNPSAPTPSTKAIIDGNFTTGQPAQNSINACSITINPGKVVTITNNYYFDIQNDIVNNGSMVVESGGSIIQHNDTALNSGGTNYTIKRMTTPFARFDYTYWSSPVSTATIGSVFSTWRTDYAFQFVTANFSDMVTAATGAAPPDGFDDAAPSPWVNASLTLPMEPGRGYAIMGSTAGVAPFPRTETLVFPGKINNGPQTYTLGLSGNAANTNDDFNLVGNPYPSGISANLFINANLPNISGTLYFWTHKGDISSANPGPNMQNFVSSDYAMYNLSGGTATATAATTPGGSGCGTCGVAPTGNIASGQGFLVEAQSTNNIVFNNTMRDKLVLNNNFYRNSDVGEESPKDRFWLDMSNPDGYFSEQLIAYFDNTTLGYDPGYDGIVNNNRPRLSFYSFATDDLKLRIQARPTFETSDVVPLGYASAVNGQFTIALGDKEGVFADADTFIYLHDNVLNVDHNLKQSPYTFTNTYGVYDNRFEIRYTNSLLGTNQSIKITGDVGVTVNNKQIEILSTIEDLATVQIYDITGKLIFNQRDIASKSLKVQKLEIADQALIVKITLANGAIVNKKIIVK